MKLLLQSAIIFFGTLIAAALLLLGDVPVGAWLGAEWTSDTAAVSVQAPR